MLSVQFFIAIWNTQSTAYSNGHMYYPIGNSTRVSDFLSQVTVGIPSYKLASVDTCNKWQRVQETTKDLWTPYLVHWIDIFI